MPLIRNLMPKVRIMDKSTCKQYFFYFLDLVDVADNTENSINIDSGPCSEIQFQSKHSCPKSITTNVVEVLRKRLDTSPNKLDPITEQVIRELRTANEKLRHQVKSMDAKLNKLIGLIEDLK